MSRFTNHKWWLLTVVLTAPVFALAQSVPNVFVPGTPISSQQVNDNFKSLSDRLDALEAKSLSDRLDALEAKRTVAYWAQPNGAIPITLAAAPGNLITSTNVPAGNFLMSGMVTGSIAAGGQVSCSIFWPGNSYFLGTFAGPMVLREHGGSPAVVSAPGELSIKCNGNNATITGEISALVVDELL